MFNLTDIMQSAQSGQAIDNLATQFGVSPQQAEAAVNSFLPSLSMGLQNKVGTPDGFASLLELMTGQTHLKAFTTAAPVAAPEQVDAAKDAMGTIFGSNAAQQALAHHAAALSGISNSVMNAMMPVITSMILGGLSKAAANQGLGGLLNAANNGTIGNVLGQMMGQAGGTTAGGLGGMLSQMTHPAGQPGANTGLAGMFNQMMGQMMSGAQPAQQPASQSGPTPIQAGLEMFQAMLNHGQQVHETHATTLQNIFETMMKR